MPIPLSRFDACPTSVVNNASQLPGATPAHAETPKENIEFCESPTGMAGAATL